LKKGNEIKIEVRERNEETGEVEVVGFLNKIECSFLLQYAINALMSMGTSIDLKKESEENRFQMPEGDMLQ
jgi:hypothetical protein